MRTNRRLNLSILAVMFTILACGPFSTATPAVAPSEVQPSTIQPPEVQPSEPVEATSLPQMGTPI